jgi:hypothetical protein
MITKQIGTSSYRFGVAVKDDGYGNLCLANMKDGVALYQTATSWFKDLAYVGKSNIYARHCCGNNGRQGGGIFGYTTTGRGYSHYPCWEYGVATSNKTKFLRTARPKSNLVSVTQYGNTSYYVPVSPYSPYDPDTGVLTIRPLGISTLYSSYTQVYDTDTALGSMICNFDADHSYMVVQLITLRTINSLNVTESVIESHCGVIGGGLPGMQWGNRLTMPTHDTGYIDVGEKMISNMGTGIPTAPPNTSSAATISYGAWTYHKSTYNGETTYFCMRYVYLGKWINTIGSSDKASSLMEPGLYCDVDTGPLVVETVVAAAQWN